MKSAIPVPPVRPFPHVSGETKRFKAEPTKLTGVAARVMSASGNFSTKHGSAPSFSGLWAGALALLVMAAGTLAVAGGTPPADQSAPVAGPQLADSDQAWSLGVGEFMEPAAPKAPAALDAQDRYEIDRLFRLTARAIATASQDLAPAAGPPKRGPNAAR